MTHVADRRSESPFHPHRSKLHDSIMTMTSVGPVAPFARAVTQQPDGPARRPVTFWKADFPEVTAGPPEPRFEPSVEVEFLIDYKRW